MGLSQGVLAGSAKVSPEAAFMKSLLGWAATGAVAGKICRGQTDTWTRARGSRRAVRKMNGRRGSCCGRYVSAYVCLLAQHPVSCSCWFGPVLWEDEQRAPVGERVGTHDDTRSFPFDLRP